MTKETANQDDVSSLGSDDYSFVDVGSCNLEFLIKIAVHDESTGLLKHHRVRLKDLVNSSGEVSFSKLKTYVKKICGERKKLELSYQDEDGDLCLVTSTSEFLDAVNQFVGKGTLKLEASSKKTREQRQKQQQQKDDDRKSCSDAPKSDTIYTDPSVTRRVLRAMRGGFGHSHPNNAEECPEDMALSHLLLDDFQEHINFDFMPAISVEGALNPDVGFDPEAALRGPLVGYYNLKDGTQRRSKFLAMDDIYLDLTQEMPRDDVVCIGMPVVLLERLSASIQPGMNAPAGDDFTDHLPPPEDALEPVEAKFDRNNPPPFVTLKEQLDSNGKPTGSIITRSEGPLSDIIKSFEHRHFYKISAVFQAENKYVPNEDRYALTFSLVALRVYSVEDELKSRSMPGIVDDPVYVD